MINSIRICRWGSIDQKFPRLESYFIIDHYTSSSPILQRFLPRLFMSVERQTCALFSVTAGIFRLYEVIDAGRVFNGYQNIPHAF